ncbi:M14 family zinc carboxypeptidase [Oceanobacillus alkalisoli]|uniref:M14 family zinc carboxypeptidase n=1 Tax=Oceanobacillus alkalisoli TaxID=2925113 RepID=UPI001EE410F6|nr:M14 family zinc carboxypeptidase [Oceanobacillus alkalisoli]MCG5104456.1 DUF2817 domain-containing protein [Oceanobacillus alkalisoli]
MAIKPVSGKIESQEINDNLSYLDSRMSRIITTPVEGVSAEEIADAREDEDSLGDRIRFIASGDGLDDKAATSDKRTVLGNTLNVVVNTAVSHPNVDKNNNTVTFYSGTFFYWNKRRNFVSGDYIVDYSDVWNDGNTIPNLYYNTETNTIRVVASDELLSITEDELFVMSLLKTWDGKLKYVVANFPFTIDGRNPDEDEILKLSSVGGLGQIGLRPNSPRADIDNNNKTLFIPSGAAIYYRDGRYTVSEDTTIQFLSGSASLRQHVYYNIANGNFIVRRGLHTTQTTENEILIWAIEWLDNNRNTITYIWTTCDYTINGKNPIEAKVEEAIDEKIGDLKESKFTFAPTVLSTDYQSTDGKYPAIINSDEYHTNFAQLISDHPDFLSRNLQGKDGTGQYDIFEYHAGADEIEPPGTLKPRPKIIITAGVHGYERTSPIALYYFIKDICENWQNDPVLEYFRWNVDIIFNPIVNPYGYNTTNRVNGNSVDINRNFPDGWVSSTVGESTYGGPSPASEVETQYVMNTLQRHLDALAYLDHHTNGNTRNYSDYSQMFWVLMNSGYGIDNNIMAAGKYTLEKMTRATIERYGFPNNVGHFGHMTVAGAGGMAQRYGSSLGIPSTVIETFFNLPTEEGSFTPSYNAIRSSTDYIGIFLAALINQFNK